MPFLPTQDACGPFNSEMTKRYGAAYLKDLKPLEDPLPAPASQYDCKECALHFFWLWPTGDRPPGSIPSNFRHVVGCPTHIEMARNGELHPADPSVAALTGPTPAWATGAVYASHRARADMCVSGRPAPSPSTQPAVTSASPSAPPNTTEQNKSKFFFLRHIQRRSSKFLPSHLNIIDPTPSTIQVAPKFKLPQSSSCPPDHQPVLCHSLPVSFPHLEMRSTPAPNVAQKSSAMEKTALLSDNGDDDFSLSDFLADTEPVAAEAQAPAETSAPTASATLADDPYLFLPPVSPVQVPAAMPQQTTQGTAVAAPAAPTGMKLPKALSPRPILRATSNRRRAGGTFEPPAAVAGGHNSCPEMVGQASDDDEVCFISSNPRPPQQCPSAAQQLHFQQQQQQFQQQNASYYPQAQVANNFLPVNQMSAQAQSMGQMPVNNNLSGNFLPQQNLLPVVPVMQQGFIGSYLAAGNTPQQPYQGFNLTRPDWSNMDALPQTNAPQMNFQNVGNFATDLGDANFMTPHQMQQNMLPQQAYYGAPPTAQQQVPQPTQAAALPPPVAGQRRGRVVTPTDTAVSALASAQLAVGPQPPFCVPIPQGVASTFDKRGRRIRTRSAMADDFDEDDMVEEDWDQMPPAKKQRAASKTPKTPKTTKTPKPRAPRKRKGVAADSPAQASPAVAPLMAPGASRLPIAPGYASNYTVCPAYPHTTASSVRSANRSMHSRCRSSSRSRCTNSRCNNSRCRSRCSNNRCHRLSLDPRTTSARPSDITSCRRRSSRPARL